MSGGVNENFIYQISCEDGSIIKTLPKDPSIDPVGMTFALNHLWMTDTQNDLIHKVDTTNGLVVENFPSPDPLPDDYPAGMAWDGENFWIADANSGIFYQIDSLGNVLNQSQNSVSGFINGLTFINGNIWYTENVQDLLREMDPSDFSTLQTFELDLGTYPNGLAFDGQYLWLAVADENTEVDSIYKIELGLPIPVTIAEVIETTESISAYPNPVAERLQFNFSEIKPAELTHLLVYNSVGTVMVRAQIDDKIKSLDISHLPSGMYTYSFKHQAGYTYSGKFMKH